MSEADPFNLGVDDKFKDWPSAADENALDGLTLQMDAAAPEWPAGFTMTEDGLLWVNPNNTKESAIVAGRFDVLAETCDDAGGAWGLLLHWKDRNGRAREWAMPRALLSGDAIEVRRYLLDGGLHVPTGKRERELLARALEGFTSALRARAVSSMGWHGVSFAFPDGALGDTGKVRTILQTGHALDHAYAVKGTLADWQSEVASYTVENSRLLFAISAAFAAPLLRPCGVEGGGINFVGSSSIGKTTALHAAGSAWGGSDRPLGYLDTWRATSNGLEAVAEGHNDALLCLDEMGQISAKEAAETAYMLANGSGRIRANRDASLRRPKRWRTLFLSSGEIGLADKIAEDGRRTTAGQLVRVIDIPAATGVHGLFENLHDFKSGAALAGHLKAATARFYGTAARAFIAGIAGEMEQVKQAVAERIASFVSEHCPKGADGQVERVASRFGLIAAAGEHAAKLYIVPWDAGMATEGAKKCFKAWLAHRGSATEPHEIREGIRAVATFISANMQSRFIPAWEAIVDKRPRGDDDRTPRLVEVADLRVQNIAGFSRRLNGASGGWDFYITTEAWPEITKGFDRRLLAEAMVKRKLLIQPDKGHFTELVRVPGYSSRRRLYHLTAAILERDE